MMEDDDGFRRLDTFARFATNDAQGLTNLEWLEDTRGHIVAGLERGRKDASILSKYLWLALRFNERLAGNWPVETHSIPLEGYKRLRYRNGHSLLLEREAPEAVV